MPLPLDNAVARKARRDVLKICSIGTLFVLPLVWAIELLVAENGALSALLLYLPQHVYLLAPLILITCSLCKRRLRLAILGGLSLAFCLVFPLGWKAHFSRGQSAGTVRVVSFNVQRGEGNLRWAQASLRLLQPDIVCLQETGRSRDLGHNSVGRDIALRSFPGWSARFAGDVTTLSRFPIQSEHIYPLPGTRRTLETVVLTPRGPLRVLNTHVSTSFQGDRAPKSKLDRIALLFETAQPSAQARLDQLPALRAAINGGNARLPLVLAGDFNTPPRGYFYAGLARGLDDAFARTGNGLGQTFPSRLPLLHIDFVWTRLAKALSSFVGGRSGSDHRPLVADIEVTP